MYCEALILKFKIVNEFKVVEGGGYGLLNGITKSSGSSSSPLNVKLLTSLLKVWQSMTQIANKLFTKPLFLWKIRL